MHVHRQAAEDVAELPAQATEHLHCRSLVAQKDLHQRVRSRAARTVNGSLGLPASRHVRRWRSSDPAPFPRTARRRQTCATAGCACLSGPRVRIVRGRLGRPARPVVHTSLHVDRRGPIDHMHRLIKFASLFTKNKVIDRISFVGMDVVRKHFDEGRSQPPRVHAACRLAPVCMRACDQEVSGHTCWHETVRCYRQVLRARRTCTCTILLRNLAAVAVGRPAKSLWTRALSAKD